MKRLIIFDLDGTLIDTIADLAAATNYALRQLGYPEHPLEIYKNFVGNGINKLLFRALPESHRTDSEALRLRPHFLDYYNAHNCDLTRPYDGIESLLAKLQSAGYQLAVASNKYQQGTEHLVSHFFPEIRFSAVFGQREGVPVKPDPTIVTDILSAASCTRSQALYVGDSDVDMCTAHNAQVDVMAVTWGFRSREELQAHTPNFMVDEPKQILEILEKLNNITD